MILYVVLLILLVLLWYFSWRLSGYELLSPASVNTLAFMGGTLLAIIGLTSWNKIELRLDGFLILILGCVSFAAASVGVRWLMGGAHSVSGEKRPQAGSPVKLVFPEVATWKLVALTSVAVLAFVLSVQELYSMAASSGVNTTSFNDLMKWARQNTGTTFSVSGVHLDEGHSLLVRGLNKLSAVCQYLFPVGFALTLRDKDRRKECLAFAIGCLFLMAKALLSAGRDAILHIVLCVVLALFIQDLRSGKKPLRVARDYALAMLVILCVALPVFYFSTFLIGRGTSSKFVEYITFYFGGGIPSLQYALDSSLDFFTHVGEATFYGVYTWLYKLYLIPDLAPYAGDFITLGTHGSNIYTSYFRYFSDFGYVGVGVLSGLAGAIFTALYQVAKRTDWLSVIVWFCYAGTYLFDGQREEYLFSRMLAVSNVLVFAMLAVTIAWLEWPANKDKLRGLVPKRFRKQGPAVTQGED